MVGAWRWVGARRSSGIEWNGVAILPRVWQILDRVRKNISGINGPFAAHFPSWPTCPGAYSGAMHSATVRPVAAAATVPARWAHGRLRGLAAALGALAAVASSAATAATPAAAVAVQPLAWGTPGGPEASARAPDDPITAELENTLRTQLQQVALASTQQALPGVTRVDIEVGRLDPRLRLAPCQRVEPYLPTGTRLWGKSRIGLRCAQGPTPWNVYLPITVKVYGMAWVASGTLAAGAVLGPADLVQAEVDWAEDSTPVISDPSLAVGRVLLRRVTAGQGLRSADLRPRQWFAAGDMVKLVAIGPGFTVTGSGEALTHGIEGQAVRVRTDGGKVVTGQAAGERRVEIRP